MVTAIRSNHFEARLETLVGAGGPHAGLVVVAYLAIWEGSDVDTVAGIMGTSAAKLSDELSRAAVNEGPAGFP